jgi:hypothetical protein
MPQVPGYVYAKTNDGIWVNLYAANEAEILLGDRPVRVTQQGNYPWDGEIVISVDPGSTQTFSMNLRKPGWCDSMEVSVNGDEVENPQYANGYMVIERAWNSGDEIEIDMEMVTRRIQAHPQVASNRGRVSLERGPIVFCLEAVDNDGAVFNLALPRDGDLDPDFEEDLFGGIVTIQAEGHRYPKRDWTNHLYMPAIEESKDADVTAVPYCVWDNRAPGEMVVWIPEVTGM